MADDRIGANPIWSLFDATAQHKGVRITCPHCMESKIVEATALWWMFYRHGWNDSLKAVPRRLYCKSCRRGSFRDYKVRPVIELTDEPSTENWPMPSALDWKHATRRRR